MLLEVFTYILYILCATLATGGIHIWLSIAWTVVAPLNRWVVALRIKRPLRIRRTDVIVERVLARPL